MFDQTSRQIRNAICFFFIGALFTIFLPIPYAWSIYGGKEANANPIVVALIRGQFNTTSGCSGALVAPQIIFTAAHCLTGDPKSIWIPSPGSDLRDTKSLRIQADDFLIPEGFTTKSFPYENDFGIIILKYSFPNVKKIEIATLEQIRKWTSEESDVLHIGYGCTELVDSPPCSRTSPIPFQFETQLRKTIPIQFEVLKPNTFTLTKISIERTICGGDSGSPLLKFESGSWIYIGAQSSSNGAGCTKFCNELCSASQGLPASNFLLIEKIQNFLSTSNSNEVLSVIPSPSISPYSQSSSTKKMSTIFCVKGKLIRKVTAIRPKCPTGFKIK